MEHCLCLAREQTFKIASHIGPIASISEVTLLDSHLAAAGVPGFAPAGSSSVDRGHSTATTIAGGDVRVFKIKLAAAEDCTLLPPVLPQPNPSRIAIKLDQNSLQVRTSVFTVFVHTKTYDYETRCTHTLLSGPTN